MYSRIGALQTPGADVVIRPNVGSIGSADFERRHEAILEGEKAALNALPAIRVIVDRLRAENRLN